VLAAGQLTEALEALRIFSDLAQEGDSRELIRVVEERDYPQKQDRELFLIEVCQCLGRMVDTLAVPILEDWIHPKGLMDKLKDRPRELKKAALQALGQYRSQQVRSFLEKYVESGDKDLRHEATQALKMVTERLTAP
jgi:hypothetical protein